MLSILIPVYNYDIFPLVKMLNEEAIKMEVTFEILCLDDASDNLEIQICNKAIQKFSSCFFEILTENIGRSKIRNKLAEKAHYENLIFLDADVVPIRQGFIKSYLDAIAFNDVIFGGISYPKTTNSFKKSLHYKYGKNREAVSFKNRLNAKSNNFTSANFAIKKTLFKKVKFNDTFKTYGYEDLLFSKDLLLNGHKISQIDNPVVHNGILENNSDFILKEHESLETLHKLYINKNLEDKNVRLLSYYCLLKKNRISNLYLILFKLVKLFLLKNLRSKRPSLFLFDLYRLGYFCSIKN